jgi:hypothetical protein
MLDCDGLKLDGVPMMLSSSSGVSYNKLRTCRHHCQVLLCCSMPGVLRKYHEMPVDVWKYCAFTNGDYGTDMLHSPDTTHQTVPAGPRIKARHLQFSFSQEAV